MVGPFENTQEIFGNSQQPEYNTQPETNTQDFSVKNLFGMPDENEPIGEDPLALTNNPQPQQPQNDNDQVRYQFFQSQYDKERLRAQELERKIAEYEQKLANSNQNPQPESPQQPAEPERFPDFNVPEPQMPMGFNLQDAYTDPNSVSAQYMSQKNAWEKNFREYQNLKLQYVEAVNQEKLDRIANEMNSFKSQVAQRQQYEAQINNVIQDVKTKFGADDNTARNFVNFMSDNNNFNLENMFKFYQQAFQPTPSPMGYPQGQQAFGQRPQMQGYPMVPSPEFNQMRNAQSMPRPMGVVNPGAMTNNNDGPGRSLIKSLILEGKQRAGLFNGN